MSGTARQAEAARLLAALARWRAPEIAFWGAAAASLVALRDQALLLNEIAILALFALSVDLVLGFAGILTLGQAAFFGVGAYAAGLAATLATPDPLAGLVIAALAAGLVGFATSFLVLRGADLTRLMVTLGVSLVLGEIANDLPGITGGADGFQGIAMGRLLGAFDFDLAGHVAYAYSLAVLFVLFLLARRIVHSPFGWSLRAIAGNRLRATAIGIPADRRLVVIYTIAAAYAGIAGGLLAQTTALVSLDVFDVHRSANVLLVLVLGGVGWLYGGLIGAVVFDLMQNWLSALTPQYWQFWIGLLLVAIVLVGRERIFSLPARLVATLTRRLFAAGGFAPERPG